MPLNFFVLLYGLASGIFGTWALFVAINQHIEKYNYHTWQILCFDALAITLWLNVAYCLLYLYH